MLLKISRGVGVSFKNRFVFCLGNLSFIIALAVRILLGLDWVYISGCIFGSINRKFLVYFDKTQEFHSNMKWVQFFCLAWLKFVGGCFLEEFASDLTQNYLFFWPELCEIIVYSSWEGKWSCRLGSVILRKKWEYCLE